MKFWIITVGEPLPTDPGRKRLWRSGLVAALMAKRGHDVTWWTSTMDHFGKVLQYQPGEIRELAPNHRLIYLHGMPYKSALSLQRILNHRQLGAHFRKLAPHHPKPDVILCSLPTLELSREAVRYGQTHHVPVVLDIRDQWPDFMMEQFPRWLRPLAHLLLKPMRDDLQESCQKATSILSNAPGFIPWGAKHGGRKVAPLDKFFPHGYPISTLEDSDLVEADQTWDEMGVLADDGVANICFLGTIRNTVLDFDPVIEAARDLQGKVRFVLGGLGDDLESLKKQAKGLESIVFAGWLDEPALKSLMNRSVAGLAPYRQTATFMESLPNKPVEYMASGLPVLSSLEGYTKMLLTENDCGYFYQTGDVESLKKAVEDLITDSAKRKRRGEAAYRLFLDRFSADKVYGHLADYLEEIPKAAKV